VKEPPIGAPRVHHTADEPTWQWPTSFVAVNARRLHDLGAVVDAWVDSVVADLAAAEAEPASVMLTPVVLEILAVRG